MNIYQNHKNKKYINFSVMEQSPSADSDILNARTLYYPPSTNLPLGSIQCLSICTNNKS